MSIIRGTSRADFLFGDIGGDLVIPDLETNIVLRSHQIFGFGGADRIFGDVVGSVWFPTGGFPPVAGSLTFGNDLLDGGSGDDRLYGDAGGDVVGPVVFGNDLIRGGSGNDTLFGDVGGKIELTSSNTADGIFSPSGNDTILGQRARHDFRRRRWRSHPRGGGRERSSSGRVRRRCDLRRCRGAHLGGSGGSVNRRQRRDPRRLGERSAGRRRREPDRGILGWRRPSGRGRRERRALWRCPRERGHRPLTGRTRPQRRRRHPSRRLWE